VLDEPAVVLLAATASAICLLLEVALPTVGLAGTAGLALGGLAAWGAHQQGDAWWPLFGVVAAVAVWGVLIARHHRSPGGRVIAAALFLFGALGYARTTGDVPAAVTAVVATALLAAVAFPRIASGAERLNDAPVQHGMAAVVGTVGVVDDWEDGRGRVLVEGTRWSAAGPADLAPGDEVTVTATSGLSLSVDRVRSAHG
jgi:membrane protein implicated in regulation of membrane protease activity